MKQKVVIELDLQSGSFDSTMWTANMHDINGSLLGYISGTQPVMNQFEAVPEILEAALPELSADDIVKLKSAGFDTQDLIRLNQHGII